MIMAIRSKLWMIATLIAIAAVAQLLMADCDKGDDKGPYNPTSPTGGGTIWHLSSASPQRVLLLGTSITLGVMMPASDTGGRLDQRLADDLQIDPTRVINRGVSGLRLAGLAAAFSDDLALIGPGDVVVIEIGMNDLQAYPGDAYWTSTYHGLVVQAMNAGLYVEVSEITPLGSTESAWEPLRERLNGWLTAEFGAGMVLPYSAALQVGGSPPIPWIAWQNKEDEIHPNGQGTGIMAGVLAARLRSSGWFVS